MTNKYTAEEVLEIFKEQHRLCSPLDPEADPEAEITAEMTIREWRWANDLVGWKELSKFLNQEFRINLSEKMWYEILEPAGKRQLIDVCRLISKHATKEYFQQKILFGTPCMKANVFLTIKRNLANKGVNVSRLRPSSNLAEYIEEYGSPVLEEITLTVTKPIDKIQIRIRKRKKGFWSTIINIFKPERYETVSTGEIKTFRDLVEKIMFEKTAAI